VSMIISSGRPVSTLEIPNSALRGGETSIQRRSRGRGFQPHSLGLGMEKGLRLAHRGDPRAPWSVDNSPTIPSRFGSRRPIL